MLLEWDASGWGSAGVLLPKGSADILSPAPGCMVLLLPLCGSSA